MFINSLIITISTFVSIKQIGAAIRLAGLLQRDAYGGGNIRAWCGHVAAANARSSKARECRRGWDEVRSVRSYSRAYLALFETGTVPIPFGCLDGVQLERLRAFALGRSAADGITLPA